MYCEQGQRSDPKSTSYHERGALAPLVTGPGPEVGFRHHQPGPKTDTYQRGNADPGAPVEDNGVVKERNRRIAEMQSNALQLEKDRRQRVAEIASIEGKERLEDDKQRSERGRFVSQLHLQLQEENLDERLRRSHRSLARMED